MGDLWSIAKKLRGTTRLAVTIAIAAATAGGLMAGTAQAEWEYVDYAPAPFTAFPSTSQAGGHPDLHVHFVVQNHLQEEYEGIFSACNCADARDITTSLPAGVIGNPNNIPRCTQVDFNNSLNCSPDTQVGIAFPAINGNPNKVYISHTPIYNLVPHPDQAGLLGFFLPLANTPAYIVLSARTGGDFGLDSKVEGIEHIFPTSGFGLNLWGVPADSSHDSERCTSFEKLNTGGPRYECQPGSSPEKQAECPVNCPGSTGPSNAELKPFLDNPTTCTDGLSSKLEVLFYNGKETEEKADWPAGTGCDLLTFNPSLFAQPTATATDSPSGLDVDLRIPQIQSPTAPSPSETRATTVTLPEGMSINPNAADGKTTCSDSQARFGTTEEAECPERAKVGTLSLTSTALAGPIPGAIYLGDSKPGDRYRLILTANGYATHVKLAGSVNADAQTGRLVASFPNLPQAPFSDFNLHFFGSERGLLATPTQCGTYAVSSTFTPWAGALSEQTSTQYFKLDSGSSGSSCPASTRPLDPGFEAAVTDATAGVHSPFFVNLTRSDGDQNLAALTVSTPPGFSATLKGVPYCPDAALAAVASTGYTGVAEQTNPRCPAASQIGEATAGAGAGTRPVHLPGKVYLAGPYKGAPLSLAVITPAVSGTYDLGNVVVRAGIHVDPVTAQVTAVSDSIPLILEGIPLRLRSILVNLDRPGFALNPTNCDPFSVGSETHGDQGTVASTSAHFQVSNCAGLPFRPRLALKLTGSTKQAGNPALTATLTAKPGEANISRAQVTLPPTELVDNAHIKNLCTRVQFNEGETPGEKCPPSSILGFAKADTPLLEKPLEGPIYLRATGRAGLPDVVAALNGQIDIVLDGHVDSVHGSLRTTFENVPDAPVTKVVLSFNGGHKGIIENSPKLCAHAQHFTAAMTGQNGKTANRSPVLSTPCGKKHKRRARAHHNWRAHR